MVDKNCSTCRFFIKGWCSKNERPMGFFNFCEMHEILKEDEK